MSELDQRRKPRPSYAMPALADFRLLTGSNMVGSIPCRSDAFSSAPAELQTLVVPKPESRWPVGRRALDPTGVLGTIRRCTGFAPCNGRSVTRLSRLIELAMRPKRVLQTGFRCAWQSE